MLVTPLSNTCQYINFYALEQCLILNSNEVERLQLEGVVGVILKRSY